MTQEKPEDRPTAADALAEFEKLQLPKWGPSLRWRLRDREESRTEQLFYDTSAIFREGIYQVESILMTPVKLGHYLVQRTSKSSPSAPST